MILYHGSNMSIGEIDLKRGRRGKDFGQGFYLSANREQAQMMAERTVDREEAGKPTLTYGRAYPPVVFHSSHILYCNSSQVLLSK